MVGSGKAGRIILIRHGESIWNTTDAKRNMKTRFTGWANIPLSERGKQQARAAAKCLLKFNLHTFDGVYTSLLDRSINTYDIIKHEILEELKISPKMTKFKNPPIIQSWRLNERHYGALIGYTKDEAIKKYGHEAVRDWRLSWDITPPKMRKYPFYFNNFPPDFYHNLNEYDWQSVIWNQPLTRIKCDHHPDNITVEKDIQIPLAESIKETAQRVLPLWKHSIVPQLLQGKTVLVVAHSNTIRGMVKHIDAATLSDDNLKQVTIPSAIPLIYNFETVDCPYSPQEKDVKPIGKLSPLGMHGRFTVTPELLVLSLAASQHLEMSENLDDTNTFKDVLRKTLHKITSKAHASPSNRYTYIKPLTDHTIHPQYTPNYENTGNHDEDDHDHDQEEMEEIKRLLRTSDDYMTQRLKEGIMEPGWMAIPINDDDVTPPCDRRD